MVIPSDSCPSAGYQQQAYVSQGGWYPETGYPQGHAQGLQMGYNKPSPPHTSPQMMVDGGHTYQHGYGYKPDSAVSSHLPTHTAVGGQYAPGVPGKVQAVEYYPYGTGWVGNCPPFPVYGPYPCNGYPYWSVKGV